MGPVTVVGGGLAGLIAAVETAEAGVPVRLLEARQRLGGRAAGLSGPFAADFGPHALYTGGPLWEWLRHRRLHRPYRIPASPRIAFAWQDDLRRLPPPSFVRAVFRARRIEAPVDRDFRGWMSECGGDVAAAVAVGLAAPLTFDHDPGRLAAAFVWAKFRRFLPNSMPARYPVGGWGAVVGRLADHARSVGVRIETDARVESLTDLLRTGPVVVAVEPGAARRLLDDQQLRVESPRSVLLDIGFRSGRRDPYLVLGLDDVAFVDRFTAIDATRAPKGHELVQAVTGLRPGEDTATGAARLERILDAAYPRWREREVWRRRATVRESSGALDLPGATWRDRPPVAYGDGLWLAGDWVAAPGHLAEVSCASALKAATAAVAATRRRLVAQVPPNQPARTPAPRIADHPDAW